MIDPARNGDYSNTMQASAVTRGLVMRNARWILCVLSLSAAACASTVNIGDTGESGAGTSSGGAQGDAGIGGAAAGLMNGLGDGGAIADCADTLIQVLPPIQATCPMPIPAYGSSCEDQVENSICVWQINPQTGNTIGYRAFGCYQGLRGKIWSGIDVRSDGEVSGGGDYPLRPQDAECPRQAPTLGASCASAKDTETCFYPGSYCECGPNLPGKWLCDQTVSGKVSPPVPVQRLCTPTSFDETQLVKDMGPELTALWCQWRARIAGRKEVPVSGRDSPGVADSYQYRLLLTPEMGVCLAEPLRTSAPRTWITWAASARPPSASSMIVWKLLTPIRPDGSVTAVRRCSGTHRAPVCSCSLLRSRRTASVSCRSDEQCPQGGASFTGMAASPPGPSRRHEPGKLSPIQRADLLRSLLQPSSDIANW